MTYDIMWGEVPDLDPKVVRCLDRPGEDLCFGLVELVQLYRNESPSYVCRRCGCWWQKTMLDAMTLIEGEAGAIPKRYSDEVWNQVEGAPRARAGARGGTG
ncbi:MAG: hypothetical protein ABR529_11685 [Actinomycetota bacterium]